MKIRKIDIKKDEIICTHKGKEIRGTYSAYVGKYGRILEEGEMLSGRFCDWGGGQWEPGWSTNGKNSFWAFEKKGRKILDRL